MTARKATKAEEAIAKDETTGGQLFSLTTGEMLRAKGLCPLVVVRTYGAGVHVGYLARSDGQEAELIESRRIWSWTGANTLDEVAEFGVAEQACISKPMTKVKRLTSVIETLEVTEKAAPSLLKSRWVR